MRLPLGSAIVSLFSVLTFSIKSLPPAHAQDLGGLPNYFLVSPGIMRGGQPSLAGLQTLKGQGVKTIINLRCGDAVERESKQAKDLGFNFVSIPMTHFQKPTEKVVRQFLSILKDPNSQPVYVHCCKGEDRTGTMIALYREEVENWSAGKAYDEMLKDGFHPFLISLSVAVFDYEQAHKPKQASTRPFGVKLRNALEESVSVLIGKHHSGSTTNSAAIPNVVPVGRT